MFIRNFLILQLARECLYEVRRVMRQRAVSVDLLPEIEEPCISDLGKFCSLNVEKGEVIICFLCLHSLYLQVLARKEPCFSWFF